MRFFSALGLTSKNAPTISLKAGVYRCPRTYGVDELHQLTQLMRAFCPSVERVQVLTWDHAATLDFLTPDTPQPTGNVVWALHGESNFTENERYRGLDITVKERFARAKPQWVFVLSESSTAVDTAWMESILGLALLRWIQEEFASDQHPLQRIEIRNFAVELVSEITADPLEFLALAEHTIQQRLSYARQPYGSTEAPQHFAHNVTETDWTYALFRALVLQTQKRLRTLEPAELAAAVRWLFSVHAATLPEPVGRRLIQLGLCERHAEGPRRNRAMRKLFERPEAMAELAGALPLDPDTRDVVEQIFAGAAVPSIKTSSWFDGNELEAYPTHASPTTTTTEYLELRETVDRGTATAEQLCRFAEILSRSRESIQQAELIFERAVAADPTSARTLRSFARFLMQTGQDDRAEELYERAVQNSPKSGHTWSNFAWFLARRRRQFARAEACYLRAVAEEPNRVFILRDFAWFLDHFLRNAVRAKALYERALAVEPDNHTTLRYFAGFLANHQIDINRAEAMFKRAVELSPTSAGGLRNYAWFLAEHRREFDLAEQMYMSAIAADQTSAHTLTNFATFLAEKRSDFDRAEAMFQEAVQLDPLNGHVLEGFAWFLALHRKNFDEAEQLIDRALAVEPNDPYRLANAVHISFLAQHSTRARTLLKDAETKSLDPSPALAVELAFYHAAHIPNDRRAQLRHLHHLVTHEFRSPGWNFAAHAALLTARNDPDAPFFTALANVLADTADPSSLNEFAIWRDAASSTP